ncbi:MAG: hypothetical protein K6357_07945 [Elusimicrobiota bacterium]
MGNYFPKPACFIYGYEPSGHHIAATAIAEYMPPNIIKPYLLSFSNIFPRSSSIIVKSYLEILQKTPILWDYLYDNQFLSQLYYTLGIKIPDFYINQIHKFLIKNGIYTIISTHAFSSIITSKESLKIKIKNNFAIITDIYAHSFWPKNLDRYFVPLYQTYKTLIENGVNQDKIEVVGMPLRKEFYMDYNITKLKKKMKINENPTFLVSGGTKGLGDIMDIVSVFKTVKRKVNLIVFCGFNKKLKQELNKIKYFHNIKIYPLSYQKNPAIYYAISDCIIGKAGGISIFETAAFKKSFIIYSPLPGQEERNARFLDNHQAAFYPQNLRELKSIIESFFINKPLFEKISSNLYKFHKKDASLKIANHIIKSI